MLIPCPECKQKISSAAASCPKCGRPLSREEAGKLASKEQRTQAGGCLGCLGLIIIILIVIIGAVGNEGKHTTPPSSMDNSTTTPNRHEGQSITSSSDWEDADTIGNEITLSPIGNTGDVMLADSESDYSAFLKTLQAGDKYGFANLLESGRIFEVPAGTHAKVIDLGGTLGSLSRVRILRGKYTGVAGWLAPESLRNSKAR